MTNDMTTPVPTWDEIKVASDELDQMARQTVLKACDVGDMLRAIRLTMGAESFNTHVSENLSRPQNWANRLIVLSFRRAAVMDALANGKANDSIRSAYAHVKALPASKEETAERDQWPRAQRGPKPGTTRKPKTEKPAPTESPAEQQPRRTSWVEPYQSEGLAPTSNLSAKQKADLKDRIATVWPEAEYPKGGCTPDMIGHHKAAAAALRAQDEAARAPKETKREIAEQKETLSQRKQREFDQLVQREIARIRAEGNKELAEYKARLDAEHKIRMEEASEKLRHQTAIHAKAVELFDRQTGIMEVSQWKALMQWLSSDRYPEEYRERLDKAVALLRQVVEPRLKILPKVPPRRESYAEMRARQRRH